MMDFGHRDQEIRDMLRQTLRAHARRLHGHRVLLFGSRATGRARGRSDYDLGVNGDAPLPLEDFYALEDALEALPTLYRFDWLDLMYDAHLPVSGCHLHIRPPGLFPSASTGVARQTETSRLKQTCA